MELEKLLKVQEFTRASTIEWLRGIEWADNSDGEYRERCPECEGCIPDPEHPAEEWEEARFPGERSGHAMSCTIRLILEALEKERDQ